ncbi:NB-ARC domain-containing protein [Dapis sp. BLCC M229]|uniref:WD40 domain-containing protein n=1 Tax=Dapis sp. BLCC M229 TaxID=3400188 RepID=UPI003CE707DF
MKVEEALEVLETVLPPGSLNAVKRMVFSQAWEGKGYSEIAEQAGYDPDYIKGVAANLWQNLSSVLEEKVTKKNFRPLLRQKFGTQKSCLAQTEPNIQQQIFQSSTETKKILHKPKIDWGEAIDVSVFYGRSQELNQLQQYIIADGCRSIALLGMGGIGKTALAAKVAKQLQNKFDYIIWRSLRHSPPLETILRELTSFFSDQECTQGELSKLIECLRNSRCLIILDSVETILKPGCTGHYRSGYENYSQLFQLISQTSHSSCLILTSREKPPEVAAFESIDTAVRSLQLLGSKEIAKALLQTKEISGSEAQKQQLSEHYSYSPLALKIVITSIKDLFDGDLTEFLQHNTATFNGIRRLLDQHFHRLSEVEKKIVVWLAVNQDWTNVQKLETDILPAVSKVNLLESLEALIWRSLVKKKLSMYAVEPLIMEYILNYLIEQIVTELTTTNLNLFISHSLIITTGKRSIKERQNQLIIEPIARQLSKIFSSTQALEQQLLLILNKLQADQTALCSYGIENLINLCMKLEIDLMVGDLYSHKIECRQSAHIYSQKAIETLNKTHHKHSEFCAIVPGKICPASQTDRHKCHENNESQLLDNNSCICPTNFVDLPDHNYQESQKQQLDRNILESPMLLEKIQIPTLDNISVIASSPNKEFLAIADKWGNVRLLPIVNSQSHIVLEGHTEEIYSIVWSPDGNFLATGSDDLTVRLWDIYTGKCLQIFNEHTARIYALIWSQNSQTIISKSEDETIKLWDISTGKCLHTWSAENFIQSFADLDSSTTNTCEFLAPTFYEVECPVSLRMNSLSFVSLTDYQLDSTPLVSFIFTYKT